MLVNEILKFISEMQIHAMAGELASCDQHLLSELKTRFSKFIGGKDSPSSLSSTPLSQSPSQAPSLQVSLTDEDYQFISGCYKRRWQAAVSEDGIPYNYLLNPNDINKKWVQFSKKLALCLNTSYLKVLLPITNEVDYHSSKSLLDTYHIYNFFLGMDNTLYRKRAFCNFLRENGYYPSIMRHPEPKKAIGTLTVEELVQFKTAKQVDSEFVEEVTNKKFSTFWEFLKKSVFANLQSRGKQSPELLLRFFYLIEDYFSLQKNNSDFKLFKREADEFFALLNKYPFEDVNYFYGNQIVHQNVPLCLVEFLVNIKSATNYSLDDQMRSLLQWLYQYNPVLRSSYMTVPSNASQATPAAAAPVAKQYNLTYCKTFILSLFITKFDSTIFGKKTISLWDKTNQVWDEADKIYSKFKSLLNDNKEDKLMPVFLDVMDKLIIPHSTGMTFFNLNSNSNIEKWYEHAKKGNLLDLGVRWLEPERLLNAIMRMNNIPHHSFSKKSLGLLTKFADEIIHTYARKQSSLLKEFRINILFSQFIENLSPAEQRHLFMLVYLYPAEESKAKFNDNCNQHIYNSLSELNVMKTDAGEIHFFTSLKKLDSSDLYVKDPAAGPICELVENYKLKLRSSCLNLSSDVLGKMEDYLKALSQIIVSIEQQKSIEAGANTLNYVGDHLLY